MKTYITKIITIIILMFFLHSSNVYSQADPNDLPTFESEDTTDVPFDGGVSLLIAAGMAYSLKQMRRKEKPTE